MRRAVIPQQTAATLQFYEPTIVLPQVIISTSDSTSSQPEAGISCEQAPQPSSSSLPNMPADREIELIDLTDSPCKRVKQEPITCRSRAGPKSAKSQRQAQVLPPSSPGPSCPICLEKLLVVSTPSFICSVDCLTVLLFFSLSLLQMCAPPTSTTIVSTRCGHLFCQPCLIQSLHHAKICPQCRTKISMKQFHPIFL